MRAVALLSSEATLALAARNEPGGVMDDLAKYYRDQIDAPERAS